ncbi:sigma-70 family RNA polymerase sigma factor [Clostridium bovifaecis]|uniref:Sigma-70 family RNA polymerase sigma factor n=1 Tax=Clostridium bovifaecis TaxID=2184719 RepID=A0A6I6FAT4_9CLOT|nr:sigma-70 family RNA polymerase sigma factor [Clostridium bovifaecis]
MEINLLKKIKEGDKHAFADLYNEYAEYALRVAMAVIRNKVSAADAVQEAFIKVYKNIHSFDLDRSFGPWFYRILINECNRVLSKIPKATDINEYAEEDKSISIKDKYKFEEYENLYKAIQNLEDINRVPIILKYLKGFKEAEIADILETNVNTVKSRLFKGRQKLKNLIEEFERSKE